MRKKTKTTKTLPQATETPTHDGDGAPLSSYDMDAKAWFAGQALNGLLANPESGFTDREECVMEAWHLADIMIEAMRQETK